MSPRGLQQALVELLPAARAPLLLCVPCLGAFLLVGGLFVAGVQLPPPMALPPVPGATALPPGANISVNSMQWSQNLFEATDEILTLAKYDQIKPGMTYDELVATLEIPEDRRPPDIELIGPESDVELKWFGGQSGEKSIAVKLRGKVVIDKTQTGLDEPRRQDSSPP
jgi:hypothetical protein